MASLQDEVVDPFQLEDPNDPLSDTEDANDLHPDSEGQIARSRADSTLPSPTPRDVPLESPAPPVQGSALPHVPLRPSYERKNSAAPSLPRVPVEDEVPALFLPGLISPSLFLPIPNTDQLSTLLNKYVAPEGRPARDFAGEWKHTDMHSLVMTNSWRALAKMARDSIVEASPDDLGLIFEQWYLRLSSLARLRLFNQAAAECKNFFSVLSKVQPEMIRVYLFDVLLPFELEVMHARTKYWAGDPYGYLDELYALLRKCKSRSRIAENETDVEMWKERAVRVGLIIASQLLEMKDHTAAANLLFPLCRPEASPSPALLSAVARVYLDSGDIDSAAVLFQRAEQDPTCEEVIKEVNRALLASAKLDWTTAVDNLRSAIKREPDNAIVANDLAVALLSVGQVDEGIQHMEYALSTSPSIVGNVEPFLFNLATLYELRTAASFDKKCALLMEVGKWAGDGLRANCLKLPPV
ncbi:hypothetical protein FRB99_001777 [Tulasnella sp. 403]|nr:hypothetical protein FRB99_001777 [Tulasnella sp. 403]